MSSIDDLKSRKKILDEKLKEFTELKDDGKFNEAYNKMIDMLTYANETLRECASMVEEKGIEIPKEVKEKLEKACQYGCKCDEDGEKCECNSASGKEKGEKKKISMIVVPKTQLIN